MIRNALKELAREVLQYFDTNPKGTYLLNDKAPRWLSDLVYIAHQDMFPAPNDYVYQFVKEALGVIACGDTEGRFLCPDFDTHELLTWVSSDLIRSEYVDEAVKAEGYKDFLTALAAGQTLEKSTIFNIVKTELLKQLV